jgi:cellobiose phosphorylase
MNRVGQAGLGESVWLGWFLVTVLNELRVDLRTPRTK